MSLPSVNRYYLLVLVSFLVSMAGNLAANWQTTGREIIDACGRVIKEECGLISALILAFAVLLSFVKAESRGC
ncbi:hypothetical protein QNH14_05870 [Apirhabdus apintestini]|nr:hypothetical protein QNH14_05870 [Enterobacteriaceae bacterium CA-0114]